MDNHSLFSVVSAFPCTCFCKEKLRKIGLSSTSGYSIVDQEDFVDDKNSLSIHVLYLIVSSKYNRTFNLS